MIGSSGRGGSLEGEGCRRRFPEETRRCRTPTTTTAHHWLHGSLKKSPNRRGGGLRGRGKSARFQVERAHDARGVVLVVLLLLHQSLHRYRRGRVSPRALLLFFIGRRCEVLESLARRRHTTTLHLPFSLLFFFLS